MPLVVIFVVALLPSLGLAQSNMTSSIGMIEAAGNTVVLVNTSNSAEIVSAGDTHAVNMRIILMGVHLGLTASDFHHS